jgi:hypothetical protein
MGIESGLDSKPSQWFRRTQSRDPARNVPAILLIVRTEHLSQRGLFIQYYEQPYAQHDSARRHDGGKVRLTEDYPQPDPAQEEP